MTRIITSEVCALGRFSRATLWRRVAAGTLPSPIDQGRQAIFDRERVVAALNLPRRRWRGSNNATPTPSTCQPLIQARAPRRWSPDRWSLA